jgi:endonuclease/exonuclease/phosphatase family metal-dependent hydrolase
MTYNVDSDHAANDETLRAIEESNVDLVFLQEVSAVWQASLRSRLTSIYPQQVYRGDDGYAAGVAILSKWPIIWVEELPRIDWFPAIRAILQTPIGPLQVLDVHLRPPRSPGGSYLLGHFSTRPIREREIRSYAAALEPGIRTVIAGDFNEGDQGRAVRWLKHLGYHNALPEFAPHATTWRWPIGVITLRARYDHIFYDGASAVLYAAVREAGRSDHLPVIVVLAPSSAYGNEQREARQ